MNIMNMAMRYLGPVVANKAASMLGINNSIATKLISAALPSIMSMFVGKSSTSGGVGALFDMLKSDKVGDPSGLEAILGGSGAGDYAQAGGGMLSDLLGGNAMSGLAGALGKYTGAGQAETESLLGMVGPVALGSLKQQVDEQGMDAAGLASFLSDQKANIAGAIPGDFAPELQASGLLGGFELPDVAGAMDTATAAVGQAASGVTDKVGEMAESAASYVPEASMPEAPKSGSMFKWLVPLLVVLGLGWYFLGGSNTPEMPDISGVDMSVDGVNVGEQFGGVMDSLKTTVGGITDADSAEAAVPQLEEINTNLDGIVGMADKLPEAAKGPFAGIVNAALESVQPMLDKALEIPGVGGILQPIVDSMLEKLGGLTG